MSSAVDGAVEVPPALTAEAAVPAHNAPQLDDTERPTGSVFSDAPPPVSAAPAEPVSEPAAAAPPVAAAGANTPRAATPATTPTAAATQSTFAQDVDTGVPRVTNLNVDAKSFTPHTDGAAKQTVTAAPVKPTASAAVCGKAPNKKAPKQQQVAARAPVHATGPVPPQQLPFKQLHMPQQIMMMGPPGMPLQMPPPPPGMPLHMPPPPGMPLQMPSSQGGMPLQLPPPPGIPLQMPPYHGSMPVTRPSRGNSTPQSMSYIPVPMQGMPDVQGMPLMSPPPPGMASMMPPPPPGMSNAMSHGVPGMAPPPHGMVGMPSMMMTHGQPPPPGMSWPQLPMPSFIMPQGQPGVMAMPLPFGAGVPTPQVPMANRGPKTPSLGTTTTSLVGSAAGNPNGTASHAPSSSSSQPPRVSVGNASLAALNSKEPPKFSCVLLSGVTAVGKTTVGRELVNSLKTDGMGWAFFSGADFIGDSSTKRTVWETTKEVFDALSKRLDELLEKQQTERSIKGLVIDKNVKGVEEVFYLSALLKAKHIPYVGIIGMECADDDVLIQRKGGDPELLEKLKYHRVVHTRVVNLAKGAGLYRFVDASKSKEEVVQALRSMVLGCCAQPPRVRPYHYEDARANSMVDNYEEYSAVMTRLCECINVRGSAFSTSLELTPFSQKELTEKNRISALKSRYGVRRKTDGNRYFLLYMNSKMYLIPPHMRACLQVSPKAWLGSKLDGVSCFVLEGDLTRLTKDRSTEKFLVYDALFWSELSRPSVNILMRMTWVERQAALASHLNSEERSSFPSDTSCIIVHQTTEKLSRAVELLDSEEYKTDGLVFQPTVVMHRTDHVLIWRPPSSLVVDFRVGELLETKDETSHPTCLNSPSKAPLSVATSSIPGRQVATPPTPTMTGQPATETGGRRTSVDAYSDLPLSVYALEVYDKFNKKYVRFESATVAVRNPDVVAGAIIACVMKDDSKQTWYCQRLRPDVLRPAYLHEVNELLSTCMIPRAQLVSWLSAENIVTPEVTHEGKPPSAPPPSYGVATASLAAAAAAACIPQPPPPPMRSTVVVASDIQKVPSAAATAALTADINHYPKDSAMFVRGGAKVTAESTRSTTTAQLLASIVPSVHVVKAQSYSTATAPIAAPPHSCSISASHSGSSHSCSHHSPQSEVTIPCAECNRRKQREDLRVDKRDGRRYCYACWAKLGWGFCSQCSEFRAGHREPKGRHKGAFVCKECSSPSVESGSHSRGSQKNTYLQASEEAEPPSGAAVVAAPATPAVRSAPHRRDRTGAHRTATSKQGHPLGSRGKPTALPPPPPHAEVKPAAAAETSLSGDGAAVNVSNLSPNCVNSKEVAEERKKRKNRTARRQGSKGGSPTTVVGGVSLLSHNDVSEVNQKPADPPTPQAERAHIVPPVRASPVEVPHRSVAPTAAGQTSKREVKVAAEERKGGCLAQ